MEPADNKPFFKSGWPFCFKNEKGKLVARNAGTCDIYAIAQDGQLETIKLVVVE